MIVLQISILIVEKRVNVEYDFIDLKGFNKYYLNWFYMLKYMYGKSMIIGYRIKPKLLYVTSNTLFHQAPTYLSSMVAYHLHRHI